MQCDEMGQRGLTMGSACVRGQNVLSPFTARASSPFSPLRPRYVCVCLCARSDAIKGTEPGRSMVL